MTLDALIFMLSAWGFTFGLLAFCIIMLVKNPQANSFLTNNDENDSRNPHKKE